MKRLAPIACLIIFSTVSLGQPHTKEILTWSQAVQETNQNNPELRALISRQQAADADLRQAKATYFPQVNSSIGYAYGKINSPNPALRTEADDSFGASISLSYPIFTGFRNSALITQADLRSELVDIERDIILSRLSFELKSAFAGLLYAQQAISLQEQIMERRQENLSLVRLRFEGGLENKGSVLLSEAYLKEASFELLQARQRAEVAQSQLARLMGRTESAIFHAQGEVPISAIEPEPELVKLLQTNPEVRRALIEESIAKASITFAQAGFFPTVAVSGDLNRRGGDWFPNTTEQWSVGLSINYPLFAGGRDRAAIASARASHSANLAIRENLDRDLLARFRLSYTNLVSAHERLSVTSSFRDAAQIRAEVARTKYNNGLISFEEWDRIETDLILREQNFLIQQRDRVTTEAAWEQIQGTGALK